jgi:hypothetical protein
MSNAPSRELARLESGLGERAPNGFYTSSRPVAPLAVRLFHNVPQGRLLEKKPLLRKVGYGLLLVIFFVLEKAANRLHKGVPELMAALSGLLKSGGTGLLAPFQNKFCWVVGVTGDAPSLANPASSRNAIILRGSACRRRDNMAA